MQWKPSPCRTPSTPSTLGDMIRLADRAIRSLKRANSFYRGGPRFVLALSMGVSLLGILTQGAVRLSALLGALATVGATAIYAGSRAHRATLDLRSSLARTPGLVTEPIAEAPTPSSVGHDGPLVTVVITSHNDARFIGDCVRSVSDQTWSSWEAIVVDHGSTDGSLDVAIDAAGEDRRWRFLSSDTSGSVSSSRNIGLGEARGEFITFLDADDYLYAYSLQRRAEALTSSRGKIGLGGVFCDWVGVPEVSVPSALGRPPMRRERITWFDASDGAPVISSAPMLLTEVVARLGGYRDRTAEDADLWNRLLRHGYALEPVLDTGVAYRQKASSRFRRTSADHATEMIAMAESNRSVIDEAEITVGTPFVYREAVDSYMPRLGRIHRLLTGLTTAVAEEDDAAVGDLRAQTSAAWATWVWFALDVDEVVMAAAMRHEAYQDEGRRARALRVVAGVQQLLPNRPSDLEISSSIGLDAADFTELRRRNRTELTLGNEIEGAFRGAVVLMPSVGYHVDEMGPLADELSARGERVVFAISDRRWPDVARALARYEYPVVGCPDPGNWVGVAAGFVTLNDWGEQYRNIVLEAKLQGVPTFGKVEGAQDFEDADVNWSRRAYRTVDHVLCQGRNDQSALAGASTFVVGSSRLERIWQADPAAASEPLAVLNSNFTYGVLGDQREPWLSAATKSCDKASLPYIVSMHPSERPLGDFGPIAEAPMRHLLTHASTLISRFSTVPFESMARGVPFVYFNPHQERVPTFHTPNGAFETAADAEELANALMGVGKVGQSYREICSDFFLDQVDVDPIRTSAARAADVILSITSS